MNKTYYAIATTILFCCVGFVIIFSLFVGNKTHKMPPEHASASVISSFYSLFNKTPSTPSAQHTPSANPSLQNPTEFPITPVPPGMFEGVTCKDSGCTTGKSNPIVIENGYILDLDGTWPESIRKLFKDALQKKTDLAAWLATKCTDPNCTRIETGPTVDIKLRPKDPDVGSCKIAKRRTFNFTSTKTTTTSCDEAKKLALEDIGKQMSNIPDPCTSCGYHWDLSKITVSCTQTPPPVKYTATASMTADVACADKSKTGYYEGWIEWNACFCCKPNTPPQGEPTLPKKIDSISAPNQAI